MELATLTLELLIEVIASATIEQLCFTILPGNYNHILQVPKTLNRVKVYEVKYAHGVQGFEDPRDILENKNEVHIDYIPDCGHQCF